MSNSLAIAAVTTTLRHVVHESLGVPEPGPVGAADVTTYRPAQLSDVDTIGDGASGLNVYLYQVTPNHAGNLQDLPTRRSDGSLARRPVAALDLHYLVTAYGDDAVLEPQRLLARASLALAATPVFTREVIEAAMAKYGIDDTAFLTAADLADQRELVKVSLAPLSLEEVSTLWGSFGTPYLLSLGYAVTAVLMEAPVAPRPSAPVRTRSLGVAPTRRVELVSAEIEGGGPSVVGARLRLRGAGLLGPGTAITLGEDRIAPDATDSTTTELVATVPDTVRSGIHALRVIEVSPADAMTGEPERVEQRSNALAWPITPTVGIPTMAGTDVSVPVSPALRPGQRATLTVGRLSGGTPGDPDHLAITFPPVAEGVASVTELTVPAVHLGPGTWLVRVEVDGVISIPTMVGDTYDGPAVTVP